MRIIGNERFQNILNIIGVVSKYGVLLVLAAVFLFPFIWMVLTSFKTPAEIISMPITWVPKEWRFANYVEVVTELPFARAYLNSIIVSGSISILIVLTSSLAGFALAKFKFRGSNLILAMTMASMFIPLFSRLIPMYWIVNWAGWTNTYWGLIIPFMCSAFGCFLMRQFIVTIPNDLIDSARMDGCSNFGIYRRIIFPLIRPIAIVLGFLNFLWQWNSFLWPLVVVLKRDMMTVQLLLRALQFETADPRYYGLQYAGLVIATVPVLVVLIALQKYLVKGITLSGVKG